MKRMDKAATSKHTLHVSKNLKKVVVAALGIFLLSFFVISVFAKEEESHIPKYESKFIDQQKIELYQNIAEGVGQEKAFIDFRDLIGIDAVRYKLDFRNANINEITSLANMFLEEQEETITRDYTNYKIVTDQINRNIDYREVIMLDSALTDKDLNVDNTDHIKQVVLKFIKDDDIEVYSLDEVLEKEGMSINDIPNEFKDKESISTQKSESIIIYRKKSLEEVCEELGFFEYEIERAEFYSNEGLSMLLEDGVDQETEASKQEFINLILDASIENYERYNIYPSITISLAILESEWGNSKLARENNNLFGIMEESSTNNLEFKEYNSFNESIMDYGMLLNQNSIYRESGVFIATDYSEQIQALENSGYVTDSKYFQSIIDIIIKYELNMYDDIEFDLDDVLTRVEYIDGDTTMPYYIQTDSKWANRNYGASTIGTSGCGPTSLAMVVSGLTDQNVTPIEVANWSIQNGYYIDGVGTSWELMTKGAEYYGLQVRQISKNNPDEIVNELSKGNPIIVSMGRGNFTGAGHIMVLRGVQDGKILVSDPNSRIRSNQLWDLSHIISQSNKNSNMPFWVYSK